MPTEYEVLEAIENGIRYGDNIEDNVISIPDCVTYFIGEIDSSGGQSYINPPAIEIKPIRVDRLTDLDSDLIGKVLDDNENEVGYLYETRYEMDVEINVWTTEGSEYGMDEIAESVRLSLRPYDNYIRDRNTIPDHPKHLPSTANPYDPVDSDDPPKAEGLCMIRSFELTGSDPTHDFTMSPNLRRWRQEVTVRYGELTDTTEIYGPQDYISSVEIDWNVANPDDIESEFRNVKNDNL